MKQTLLNLGCDIFKLHGFTNIDINMEVQPDILMDLMSLDRRFDESSVDFIFAGHVLEHFVYKDSLELMGKCRKVLKPFRCLMIVVPDYSKCFDISIEQAEKVIMAQGDHKMIYRRERLEDMLKKSGFSCFTELPLDKVPYLVVPDMNNPVPEKWQTAMLAMKI